MRGAWPGNNRPIHCVKTIVNSRWPFRWKFTRKKWPFHRKHCVWTDTPGKIQIQSRHDTRVKRLYVPSQPEVCIISLKQKPYRVKREVAWIQKTFLSEPPLYCYKAYNRALDLSIVTTPIKKHHEVPSDYFPMSCLVRQSAIRAFHGSLSHGRLGKDWERAPLWTQELHSFRERKVTLWTIHKARCLLCQLYHI